MTNDSISHVEDIVFDDEEKIEIAGSYPDIESAIKALNESIPDDKA